MVDFKKAFGAGWLPGVLAALLWIIVQLIYHFLPADIPQGLVAAEAGLVGLHILLFAWAGYRAAKNKQDLITAGTAGALAALLAGILILLLDIALSLTLRAPPEGILDPVPVALPVLRYAAQAVPLSMLANFVLAFLGGFMGQRK